MANILGGLFFAMLFLWILFARRLGGGLLGRGFPLKGAAAVTGRISFGGIALVGMLHFGIASGHLLVSPWLESVDNHQDLAFGALLLVYLSGFLFPSSEKGTTPRP
jgi:hypothetical protein